MKRKKILQINDSNNDIITVEFKDVLESIPRNLRQINWSLYEIEAMGDLADYSISSFEDLVMNSPCGMTFDWSELNKLSSNLYDVTNIILTGSFDDNYSGGEYKDMDRLVQSNDLVIEFFDSSYWRIYSSNASLLETISNSFQDTQILNCPEQF